MSHAPARHHHHSVGSGSSMGSGSSVGSGSLQTAVQVRADTYVDSIRLMEASRAMEQIEGVERAVAVMGTPTNLDTLAGEGFNRSQLDQASANSIVLAVRATSTEQCNLALDAANKALSGSKAGSRHSSGARTVTPRTLDEAVPTLQGANVVVISVPGPYAALEAHKALSRGLHVLLFSDNVSVEDEIELKSRAAELGLLLMGPGAGTAVVGGAGLGFANAVRRGRVGVAAAAGTGAQEVMSLLDRWGAGVSHVIGVGGRDLSATVGGRMMQPAVRALQHDPDTDVVLVVSKPSAPEVARALLQSLAGAKPAVAVLIGLQEEMAAPPGVTLAAAMDEGVCAAIAALRLPSPNLNAGDPDLPEESRVERSASGRRVIRGLFSGGTLCYEAMTILSSRLGPIYSNTPLRKEWSLPAARDGHVCLDLGEEEFTKGRPHPMIDPEPRAELIVREGKDSATAVILIDVVLGYGAHPDPGSVLAPACAEVTAQPDGPAVVAYVLGTDRDPQDRNRQCQQLSAAGCLIAPTGAASARMAAHLVGARPQRWCLDRQ